jgi:flagellar biosynthesis protein FlhA
MANAIAKPNEALQGGGRFGLLTSPDVQFAVGLIGIIFTMILPLPPLLLDMLLSLSITVSFLILLTAIYIREPLDFSSFPTVLLITTLFRLGLNVATTRNILLDAASGSVSHVIVSFGNFVIGGNYFVGFVIFVILVVINFIVITKGAGRVAEVGARFTLDAMPGKQMAIDAELNAGLIDKEEAKTRRKKVEQEADFYGAMDGASKFVRGDAIAGIIITAVNIIVGLLLGVMQYNLSFAESARMFTLLSVGDGLVSQIPALIVSTAAGIVVTRSASNGSQLSETLTDQILRRPTALYLCGFLLLMMALIPGLPLVPFVLLAVVFFVIGRYAAQREQRNLEKSRVALEEVARPKEGSTESIEALLHIDVLALEVGVGLIPLVDTHQDGEVLERIVSARKQFAQEMGIIVPMVMVKDNIQLRPGEYQVMLKGNRIGGGTLMVDYDLAMDPGDVVEPIEGIPGKEPAYGLDATWIKESQKEEATFRGYTVVNCATIIVTHLTKLIEENCHFMLGRQEVQNLIDGLKHESPKVVEEVIAPDRLSLGDIVKIMQNLLEEKVSIRDLLTIFETLADYCRTIKNPDALTRYVRKALGRGIIKKYLSHDDKLIVVTLDRMVEDLLISGLKHREDGSSSLQIDSEIAQKILNSVAETVEGFQSTGTQPIILCGSLIRWELKQLLKRFIPGIVVIAFDELPQGCHTRSIGIITI